MLTRVNNASKLRLHKKVNLSRFYGRFATLFDQ